MDQTADVVVIGGGMLGCSTAVQLALKGAKRIVLLEKGAQVAVGASGASGGLVRMHYTVPAAVSLAWRSLHLWQTWNDWVGAPSPFVNSGFVMIVGHGDGDVLRANVRMMQGLGVDTEVISVDDLRALIPGIYTDDIGGVSYEPQSGYAYPVDATQGLANRARALGVEIKFNTAATRIRTQSGRVSGVETSAGVITTPSVVLAAGAWAGRLAQTAGVTLPLTPRRGMAANSGWPSGMGRHPVIIDRALGMYTRNDRNQRNLFGIEPALPVEPDAPDAFELEAGRMEPALAVIKRRLPRMALSSDPTGWAAPEAYTPDGQVLLGLAPGVSGLYLATGGSLTSFKTAPAIGEAVAELLLEGQSKHVDSTLFRATRFAEGKLLTGEHEYASTMAGDEGKQSPG
ncbi:MAG: FAD-binding oxidoreductase [Chloroflexi bacterium]|nr:FAD-binding oxidoreductase [Chloroflexota bacterium]